MDENEQALAPTDTEIDAAWDDEVEVADDGEQAQPEADQPKADEAPETAEKAKPSETEPKAEEKQAETDQPLTFTLKHLDEVKTVDKDEIVKLAQQGLDYERIRTERDQLRDYRKDADPALTLVKAYAEKNGMNITEYVDFCRKQELIATGIDEKNADAQISVEKQQAQLKSEQDEKAAAAVQANKQREELEKQAESRKTEMNRFLQKFPAVKPDDIPKEVWAEVAKGDSLVVAYTEHRNKQLETELAAERQNKANAQKSTGSLSTSGKSEKMDDIDRWWNDG